MDARSITPPDSPMTLDDVLASPLYLDLWAPKVRPGDIAPDFELPVLDLSTGERRDTGTTVRLQEVVAEAPVALVFGSYT